MIQDYQGNVRLSNISFYLEPGQKLFKGMEILFRNFPLSAIRGKRFFP